MKDQLQVLFELQQLERQKLLVSKQKSAINSEEVRGLWNDVRLLTQKMTADREELKCLDKVCSRQETDIFNASKQCEHMEAKLYSGEITNVKEIEHLRNSCENCRKGIAEQEKEILANMEHCEELAEQIARNEELLQQRKRLYEEKQQNIARVLAGFDRQLSEIENQYKELAGKVEAGLMAKFRELGRNIPLPVAKVDNGICGGCRISIPTNQAAFSSVLVFCDNCGRILLVE